MSDSENEHMRLESSVSTKTIPTVDPIPVAQIVAKIIRVGIPMALSYTVPASMVATGMMISRLGEEDTEDYLATAALAVTMTQIVTVAAFSPLLAMITIGGGKYGELKKFIREEKTDDIVRTEKQIADLFKVSILLSTLIVPFPFAAMYFSEPILADCFGQSRHISGLVQQNLRAYSYGLPALMYRICMEQLLFSFEKTSHTMSISLLTFSIGTAAAYYLAFGPPDLGLAGIGYGYDLEAYLTCLSFAVYLCLHPSFAGTPFLSGTWVNQETLRQSKTLLEMGLPITVQLTSQLAAALLVTLFAGWLGKNALAAQNFSAQLFVFSVIPSDAFAQTLAQVVASLLGEEQFHNAARFAQFGLLTNIGLVSLFCIPISIEPSILTRIFASSADADVMRMVRYLVPIAAGQVLAETAGLSMIQTSRSANDLRTPTKIKMTSLWLGVLAAYLLGFHTSLHIYGINIGFLLGVALGTMALAPRWVHKMEASNLKAVRQSQARETLFYTEGEVVSPLISTNSKEDVCERKLSK
ncbi:MAG: MATE family efflux transporter [Gammaproteobacteria bacterium]|nr:MATE family efflux transporter [Gammaproteobacteria bacterium]